MQNLPYLEFVLDHNKKDYLEQLSNTVRNVMMEYVDLDEAIADANNDLKEEHNMTIAKMTPDELDAAGTDFKAPTFDSSDKDEVFKLLQSKLFEQGKVMYHDTNAAGQLKVGIYSIVKEHKFQTKSTFDISINAM